MGKSSLVLLSGQLAVSLQNSHLEKGLRSLWLLYVSQSSPNTPSMLDQRQGYRCGGQGGDSFENRTTTSNINNSL